jgi:hypothetical protein
MKRMMLAASTSPDKSSILGGSPDFISSLSMICLVVAYPKNYISPVLILSQYPILYLK